MRAAVIFGLGTSPADLKPFQSGSSTAFLQGLPAASNEADAILIFGGDGTIHRHLPALVRLQLPVLVVPAGSGNDFARALKLRSTKDSLRAWRDFEAGTIRAQAIDLGVIVASAAPEQRHSFCCIAGCGLDSAVTRRANRMPRWLRGHGGYALALLPMLLKLPTISLRIRLLDGVDPGNPNYGAEDRGAKDRRTEDHRNSGKPTLLAAFANTQFYGDGMRIAPEADFTDGRLDICRISRMNPFELFCMFPTVYFGHHLLSPKVEYSKAERVTLQTDTPIEIYADGEFVCNTPAEISVAKGVLRVIYPPR